MPAGRKPPAPPPGPPPDLSDSEGEQETVDAARPRKIRFADADPPVGETLGVLHIYTLAVFLL